MKLSQNFRQDYDFTACLENNDVKLNVEEIEGSVAFVCGHNDEDEWIWVFKMKGGEYSLLSGGCDYTGWDCRSSASIEFGKTAKALINTISDESKKQSLLDQLTGRLPWGMEERKP